MRQEKTEDAEGESPSSTEHARQHENMSSDSERKNRGVRPSQPPKPECGPEPGQTHAAEGGEGRTTSGKRTQGNSQAASGSRTPLKPSSLDTVRHAGGDGVASPEPNKEQTDKGQVCGNLPGSQRVAREERIDRNLGGPADSRRANYRHETAIYEADFLPCSYGYRPARGAHDAVSELTDTLFRGRYEFVVEADIKGFFDHIRHDWMLKMLALRIDDGALVGLIGKWLQAGILEEDGRVEHPDSGTPQGGVVSPVLANVYLHYVLDLWLERRVRKQNRGQCRLFGFADDFVCCFDYRHEADAFERALKERLEKFGLQLAPDKTQTLRFGRGGGGHNGRFDFLGFEFRWDKSRLRGQPYVARRTSRKKLSGAVARFTEWIRTHRHQKLSQLMKTVAAKHRGYWNYYGIIGNSESLGHYRTETCRVLHYWLNRRSQRRSYTWQRFNRLLTRFEVPLPRI